MINDIIWARLENVANDALFIYEVHFVFEFLVELEGDRIHCRFRSDFSDSSNF